ncbi:MAG: OmpA family protein [Crocinitomicaceae bacterium]|nr:OmpA family protein [Crocinitomicaceae bacterium]
MEVFKRLLIVLVMFCASSTAFTQSKKVWLFQADYYFEKNNFPTALRLYKMVLDDSLGLSSRVIPYEAVISNQKLKEPKSSDDSTRTVSTEDYSYHQIAMCYRKSQDYERAYDAFVVSADRGAYPEDYYYVANSLMNLGKYEEAIKAYEKYIGMETASDELMKRSLEDMSGINNAIKATDKKDVYVTVSDTAVFNKGTSSFAVSYWGKEYDKVVFSSAREGNVILDPETQDATYLLDLYWSEKNGDSWDTPHNFGRPLNSSRHDASGCFDQGHAIFFTRWGDDNQRERYIYVAREIGMRFFESQKLDSVVNYPGFESINPFVTDDGKWLYYSSNRPGGEGGFDIWRIKLGENGQVEGFPENLGKPVNSEFDERAPFYHTGSKTLFFSSDGHKSFGGLDIFKSHYHVDAESFGVVKNMGKPINSSSDDSYFVADPDLTTGFISSTRGECSTCDSSFSSLCSYCYKIFDVKLPPLEFKISGYVYDMATDEILPNSTIEFKDISYQWEHFEVKTDENGYYEHELIPNLELFLRAGHKGYFADKAIVFTKGETDSRNYVQDFFLEKIPEGEITIEGIEYDFDKATLRPESKEILDRLIEFLELNNNLKIEIRSHTDERGSDTYNQKLSQARAQSVVDYLVEHGIPLERLVPKGYGESMPAEVPDHEGNVVTLTPAYIHSLQDEELQEEYHQRNRRTAFFVLEEH